MVVNFYQFLLEIFTILKLYEYINEYFHIYSYGFQMFRLIEFT